jgi:hypothetical protein
MEQSMPKKQVNESIKDKVISAIFRLLAKGDERKVLNTALGKDPFINRELKKITKSQEKIRKKIFSMPGGEEHYNRLKNL